MNSNDSMTAPESADAENPGNSGEDPQSSSSRALVPVPQVRNPIRTMWENLLRLFTPSRQQGLEEHLTQALGTDGKAGTDFNAEERAMLHNILKLRVLRVEDVMVPRADIQAIDINVTLGDLLVLFEESGHSRMPVYGDTLDDPRGMVHIRDFLAHITKQARSRRRSPAKSAASGGNDKSASVQNARTGKTGKLDLARVNLNKTVQEAGIIREVLFVPPSMFASDLMQRMQAMRTQMALVIDEYGGTDGLVSLEDIVEIVVGDIEDEHDDEADMITRQSDDVFIADAKAELEDIAELIGSEFDVGDKGEDVDTLGGLIFSVLGRIPARGEVVKALPHFEFHVLEADPRRIRKVRIVRQRVAERRRRPQRADSDIPATTQDAPSANAESGPTSPGGE